MKATLQARPLSLTQIASLGSAAAVVIRFRRTLTPVASYLRLGTAAGCFQLRGADRCEPPSRDTCVRFTASTLRHRHLTAACIVVLRSDRLGLATRDTAAVALPHPIQMDGCMPDDVPTPAAEALNPPVCSAVSNKLRTWLRLLSGIIVASTVSFLC